MLIHSPNWLGDVVMALPAFRAWRDRHADEPVHILAKRRVAAIWGFVRDVDSVIVLEEGRDGARAARAAIRAAKCDEAILLPQSFRSAWIVWPCCSPTPNQSTTCGPSCLPSALSGRSEGSRTRRAEGNGEARLRLFLRRVAPG